MAENSFNDLGPRIIGEKTGETIPEPAEIQKVISTSARYQSLVQAYGGAIVFDNGARYKPDQRTSTTKSNGYNSLELLYCSGNGTYSIRHALSRYRTQLPASLVPIGEAPGGNLICVDDTGAVFLWDHESPAGHQVWPVAVSIDAFLDKLEPDESDSDNSSGIIKSESFLNF